MRDCFSLKKYGYVFVLEMSVTYCLCYSFELFFLMHAVKLLFEDFLNKEMIVQKDNMDLK